METKKHSDFHDNIKMSRTSRGDSPLYWKPGDLLIVSPEQQYAVYSTGNRIASVGRITNEVMVLINHDVKFSKVSHRWTLVLCSAGVVYVDAYELERC